jgi:hypothetical protein
LGRRAVAVCLRARAIVGAVNICKIRNNGTLFSKSRLLALPTVIRFLGASRYQYRSVLSSVPGTEATLEAINRRCATARRRPISRIQRGYTSSCLQLARKEYRERASFTVARKRLPECESKSWDAPRWTDPTCHSSFCFLSPPSAIPVTIPVPVLLCPEPRSSHQDDQHHSLI